MASSVDPDVRRAAPARRTFIPPKIKRGAAFLVSWEIWPVAALTAGAIASERLLLLALILAALFWPLRWLAHGRLSARTPADLSLLLLVLMLPVTLWATALPAVTRPQAARLLLGIALFYALANWADSLPRLQLAAFGLALAGFGLAAMATFSVAWPSDKLPFIPAGLYEYFSNRLGDSVHPNVMAGYLVVLLPVGLALLLFAWRALRWPARLGLAFVALATTAMLLLTKSRGAWMAFAAVLLLLAILRWKWGWLALPAAGIAAFALVSRLGLGAVLETLSTSGAVNGIDGRVEIWSRAIYMIQDFPFTGIGMGSFGKVADLLYPFFLASPGSIPHAHNLFLQVAVDLGLPGLIAWLSVFGLVIYSAWRVYRVGRRSGDGWAAALGAGLLCSQLALGVHGLFDAVTWGMVRPAPLIWAIWGLALAAGNFYLGRPITGKDGETQS